jgi:hypothetical protein
MTQISKINGIQIVDTIVTGFTYDGVNKHTISNNDGTVLNASITNLTLTDLTASNVYSPVYSGITGTEAVFYGDGSNLSGLVTSDQYVSGGTFNPTGNIVTLGGAGGLSNSTVTLDINTLQSLTINGTLTVTGRTEITNNIISTGNTSGSVFDGVDYIDYNSNLNPKADYKEGRLFYDYNEHTLALYNDVSDITHQIGQEHLLRVRNETGSLLLNGKVVYISGAESGGESRPLVSYAIATGETISQAVGFLTTDISNNSYGYVTELGQVNDLNTTGFTSGAQLYLSTTEAGGYTQTKPSGGATSRITELGHIVRVDATSGQIKVGPVIPLPAGTSVAGAGSAVSTGVLEGGVITKNVGALSASSVNISAGNGIIVDNTDVNNSIITEVSWGAFTAEVLPNLTGGSGTYIFIDSDGSAVTTFNNFDNVPTPSDNRNKIRLGFVGHAPGFVSNVFNTPLHIISPNDELSDLASSIGPFNTAGNVISDISGTLKLLKTTGTAFLYGGNYHTDNTNPNQITTSAVSGGTLIYAKQDGVIGPTSSDIDPDNYDLNGTITALGNGKWTGHRIILVPSINGVVFQYGQTEYSTKSAAVDGSSTEQYTLSPDLAPLGYVAAIVVIEKFDTDFSNATIIPVGKFGGGGGSAGGGGVETLQSAYNNSTTNPEILTNATKGGVAIRIGSGDDYDNVLEGQNTAGTLTSFIQGTGNASFVSISGSTDVVYYGDGSNLTGIVHTTDNYVSGGTYTSGTLLFSGTSTNQSFSIDVSALIDDTNSYVTGATMNSNTLELSRNGGLSNVTVDLSQFIDDTNDGVVSGATMNGNTLELSRTEGLGLVTVDLSQFIDDTDQWVSGSTFNSTGNIITLLGAGGLSNSTVTLDINSLQTLTVNGDLTVTGTTYSPIYSGNTVEAVYYGDGSNLTGISTADNYVTGATIVTNTLSLQRSGGLSDVTVDTSITRNIVLGDEEITIDTAGRAFIGTTTTGFISFLGSSGIDTAGVSFQIPEDYKSNAEFALWWTMDGTSTNQGRIALDITTGKTGTDIHTDIHETIEIFDNGYSGASWRILESAYSGSSIGYTPGDYIHVQLNRDAGDGDDTLVDTMYVSALVFKYTAIR